MLEAAIRIKSTHLQKIMFENQKKENMEIFFLHKSPSKTSFRHRIHSLLRRADARKKHLHYLPYLTHIASLWVRHS